LHQLGAGGGGFLDARIDVVDRDVGHPAFRHALVVGAADVEQAADRLAIHLGDPIGAAGHRHGIEAPAHGVGVELLRAFDVPARPFVPVESAVCSAHDVL